MFKDEKHEEKYPLLLLYVQDKDRRSEFPHRVAFVDKGRGKEVSRGAATIITQWPAQLTACWLTSVVLGTGFIFLTLMFLMSTLKPLYHVHPRCSRDINNFHTNKTIHLVKNGNEWNQRQLDILKFVAETYPEYEIHNIILETSMHKFRTKRKLKYAEEPEKLTHKPEDDKRENTFDISLLDTVQRFLYEKYGPQHHNKESNGKQHGKNSISIARKKRHERLTNSYGNILEKYKNIQNRNTTFKLYFTHTPLQYYWSELNSDMIIFAVRVHELWQNGGITFYLPKNNEQQNITSSNDNIKTETSLDAQIKTNSISSINFDNSTNILQLKSLITNTKSQYDNLRKDLVIIDGQGLHMATKTPCHAFFGDILVKMKYEHGNLSVSDLIQQVLTLFCRRGAVESDYCKTN